MLNEGQETVKRKPGRPPKVRPESGAAESLAEAAPEPDKGKELELYDVTHKCSWGDCGAIYTETGVDSFAPRICVKHRMKMAVTAVRK